MDNNHSKKKSYLILSTGLFLTVLALITLSGRFLGVDTAIWEAAGGLQFFPLVHGVTNAYHNWRFDPLTGLVFRYSGFLGAVIFLHLVTISGVTFLLRALKVPFLDSFCLAILTVILAEPIAVGFDTVILGAISWLPWCLGVVVLGFSQGFRRVHYLALTLLSVLLALSANQVALLFAIGLALYIWEQSRYLHPYLKYELLLILLIPALISSFLIPGPFFERYLPFSHFVPAYNTGQGRYGLIGPEIQFPVLDIGAVREAFNYPLLYLGAGFLLLAVWRSSKRQLTRRVLLGLIVLLGSIALLALTGPHTSQISPIAAINRMLPGLSLVTLAPIIFVLTTAVFLIVFAFILSPSSRAVYIFGLSLLTWYGAGFAPWVWNAKEFQQILSPPQAEPEVTSLMEFQRRFLELSPEDKRALVSPGLYLLRKHGYQSWRFFIDDKHLHYHDLEEFNPKILAKNNTPDLLNLIDLNPNTRTRLGNVPQNGDDWLLMELGRPINLRGLWLMNDGFQSDYPRALEILVADDCSVDQIKKNRAEGIEDGSMLFKSFRNVLQHPNWEGEIRTSSAGIPYFGPIVDVKVLFEIQKDIRCILVKQPYPEPKYDWSVTGVQIVFKKLPPSVN